MIYFYYTQINYMETFTVKNAINTCYMDTILMSLFYVPSNLHKLLLCAEPENYKWNISPRITKR